MNVMGLQTLIKEVEDRLDIANTNEELELLHWFKNKLELVEKDLWAKNVIEDERRKLVIAVANEWEDAICK
jgi:hypothetical protein